MLTHPFLRDVVAGSLLLVALLTTVALVSHSPLDPSPFHYSSERVAPENLAGRLGATVSAILFDLIGLTAFLIPPLMALLGWYMMRDKSLERPRATYSGWVIIIFGLPVFAHLVHPEILFHGGILGCGGLIGNAGSDLLGVFAGPVGRVAILVFVILIGALLISGVTMTAFTDSVINHLRNSLKSRRERLTLKRQARAREDDRRKVLEKQITRLENDRDYHGSLTVKEVKGKGRFRVVRKTTEIEGETEIEPVIDAPQEETIPVARTRKTAKARPKTKETKAPVIQEKFDFIEDLESYDLPRPSFLEPADPTIEKDSAKLIEISKLVTLKCNEFKVRGEVANIRTGPVITTYEFRLDTGVKISAVQNLSADLALALRADSVRIERTPGRATVGIEVPSPTPEIIRLSQLVESKEFQNAASLLTLCLGVDIHGNPFFSDLARMPHLLIGGFTGSGKSVGINAMIMSILYKAKPDQVKFIFVDPKMVELGVYAGIPHLLTPIITDAKKATNALGWAVAEMEKRYHKLAELGVRNLDQFNKLVEDAAQLRRRCEQLFGEDAGEQLERFQPMPLIVIIIDEMADLMMTSGRAVEESITRLAQKARAVGVHLICATQRPSVDIITGVIKANFGCRIAYKVRSKFDSRTILDGIGAEHLLGRGDLLFLPPGTSNVKRIHGPLVTEKEIATVVGYIKRFGEPEYMREILSHKPLGDDKGKGRRTTLEDIEELSDPMYDQAARLVVQTRKASASYIQRRLRLGYTRSARLLDIMEREGVVGPPNGSKGREVLVAENFFGEVDETHALNDDG